MNRSIALDPVETARALGHDLRRFSHPPRPLWPVPVREGYAAAAAAGVLPRPADRFVRKWLQLRESALQRGRVIGDDVEPTLLRRIDIDRCPITRDMLTHGERSGTDWSIDRINNDGGYAANNLAVMSTRANRAKGDKRFDDVLARAGRAQGSDGLEAIEWLRMASVMLGPCFVTCPASAPLLPLAAPIPLHSVRSGCQQVQHAFTLGARRPAGKNALIKAMKPAAAGQASQSRLRLFADAMHESLKGQEHPHDAWLDPAVMSAFSAWLDSLDEPSLALAGRIAAGLNGGRLVPTERIASWHLDSRGYHA